MKILCFGDSNTYGFDPRSYFGGRYDTGKPWVDILAAKTNYEIENAGQNGLAIPHYEYEIDIYKKIFTNKSPDLLVIMLGSNDLLQGLSAKAVSARMSGFLSKLGIEKSKILLISPPAFTSGAWIPDEKTLDYSALLANFYSELSLKHCCHFVDSNQWKIPLCYDGVHFTEAGHKIFAENLYQKLLTLKEK